MLRTPRFLRPWRLATAALTLGAPPLLAQSGFSKELFFRVIAEQNSYALALAVNALLSSTARPGTVFFLGTDGGYERPADRGLRSTSRVLFFKASYLWRL